LKLSRREFIGHSAAALAAGWGASGLVGAQADAVNPQRAALPQRPNVVLIILDTLRADKLGCYGFQHDTSPEFDALARAGVQFERVIS